MKSWSRGRIASLYVLSLLPGLAGIAHSISLFVRERWESSVGAADIYSWAIMPPEPKIQHLAEYAVLVGLVAAVIIAAFVYLARNPGPVEVSPPQRTALKIYFGICLLFPLLFVSDGLVSIWLLLTAALPAYVLSHGGRRIELVEASGKAGPYVAVCSVLLVLLVGLLYTSAWSPKLRFINDYAQLPEETMMSDGRWVDNQAFFREQAIPGRYPSDPCKDEVAQGLCLSVPRGAFHSVREPFDLFPSGGGLHYSWEEEKLRAYRKPTDKECLLITALVRSAASVCGEAEARRPNTRLSSLIAEFRQKNRYEMDAQTQLGRFFFHHAYLYLPMLRATQGDAGGAAQLPAQYGFGLTQTFAKLLQWSGDTSFQNYFRLYWVGPGLYVLLAALVALLVTGSGAMGVAAAALVIALLPFQSLDGVRLAPGFNPWRHLPDLLCLLAISVHARRASVTTAVVRAAAIGFMFWWNREFGLFMLAASGVWYFFGAMRGRDRVSPSAAWWLLELAACGVALALSASAGNNELAFYNLLGVGAPKTRWREIPPYAALWLAFIGFVAWARFVRPASHPGGKDAGVLDAAGVGFCYVSFATVYGLWNPSPGHFSVVWMCAVIPLLCAFHWVIENLRAHLFVSGPWLRRYVAVTLCLFTIISSVNAALHTEETFSGLFSFHKSHEWRFPGLAGVSTADPKPVQDAVALIDRVQPQGPVTLVSRYDVLLQTAGSRLSALPYVDVPSALISWNLIDSLHRQVTARKPAVIFMDRDVLSNWEWQMLGQGVLVADNSNDYRAIYRPVGVAAFFKDSG
ncbi:MAG: hypothetical protein JWQ88_2039, partial [Rhodoferax sp.]|nr:hypothetical protein [Rhodoferax sp.]